MDIDDLRARVAELVDAHDSKSCSARSVGSIPSTGTSLRSPSDGKPRTSVCRQWVRRVGQDEIRDLGEAVAHGEVGADDPDVALTGFEDVAGGTWRLIFHTG
jgi:hypothetical protein